MSDLLSSVILLFIGSILGYVFNTISVKRQEELNKRRAIYEALTESMVIFIEHNNRFSEQKTEFIKAYQRSWLWASDHVISEINSFLQQLIDNERETNTDHTLNQVILKEKYARCSLAMRKDLGFRRTKLRPNHYSFFHFGKE